MGWNFRKSVNIGGGMRLNFSKSGVGVSGGIKGFRIGAGQKGTRMTASIPGTGLYYTKSISGGKKNKKAQTTRNRMNNIGSSYQYTMLVSNSYTGESRELRAKTNFELNQLVQLEQERQQLNEQRQRYLDNAKTKYEQVEVMNKQVALVQDEFKKIIQFTLDVDDRIDWDKQLIKDEFPPLEFREKAPKTTVNVKIGFLESLFMNENKFELPDFETAEMREFEERRNLAISEYLKKKAEFDAEKNKKNGELAYLKKRFEELDKEAIERYAAIVLTNSRYPVDFEHDFEIVYDKNRKLITVNYLFQDIDSFPITEEYVYNRETDSIEEKLMDQDKAVVFYSDILYSVGIRTIHEICESIYTDAVATVIFNGYIENQKNNQCAFSMKIEKADFEKIDLTQSVEHIKNMIEVRSIEDFTKYDQIIPYE